MTQTVLVTGGTGFVGGWCIAGLLQQGYAVRTTVRNQKRAFDVTSALRVVGASTAGLSFAIADLTDDAGWAEAMAGCDYVLHVASPLGGGDSSLGRDALVEPARDGTLRVLRAAVDAGVKRVVMTSAAATARAPLASGRVSDETIWADPDDSQFDAYRRSKIIAERAAWDFMKAQGSATELTTVLPGAVFGPIMSKDNLGSVNIIANLLQGSPRAMPKLGFWIVDVRDLAKAHIDAMVAPHAAGQRYIAAGEFLWMADMAKALRARLGPKGARVPTRELPTFMVKLMLPFLPTLRTLAPLIGRRFELTTAKARSELGFNPRPAADTLADCANSLDAISA